MRSAAVEEILQEYGGSQGVTAALFLTVSQTGARHLLIGLERGQAFVVHQDGQFQVRPEATGKLLNFAGGGAEGSVHVQGQADHQRVGGMLLNGSGDLTEAFLVVGGFDDAQRHGQTGGLVAHGQAGASLTQIDRQVTHDAMMINISRESGPVGGGRRGQGSEFGGTHRLTSAAGRRSR